MTARHFGLSSRLGPTQATSAQGGSPGQNATRPALNSDIRETAAAGFLCICAIGLGCGLGLALFGITMVFERYSVAEAIQYQRYR